jgi:hypothetical protein
LKKQRSGSPAGWCVTDRKWQSIAEKPPWAVADELGDEDDDSDGPLLLALVPLREDLVSPPTPTTTPDGLERISLEGCFGGFPLLSLMDGTYRQSDERTINRSIDQSIDRLVVCLNPLQRLRLCLCLCPPVPCWPLVTHTFTTSLLTRGNEHRPT